ncbi:MAG: FkbM family methyltransferase [Phycisphaerales bacterium]|nr:MAG: FkbM family methyltransferase [Phycisphaerales bacterium]
MIVQRCLTDSGTGHATGTQSEAPPAVRPFADIEAAPAPRRGWNAAGWALRLSRLKARMAGTPAGAVVPCLDFRVRINDGPNFYILFKDIFVQRIYHFEAARPDPLVVDCGSNIGMSVLYFKHVYPAARVIAFEPDPAIFPLLRENVERNGLERVELHQAAVAAASGALGLASDGVCASCLEPYATDAAPRQPSVTVPAVRLGDVLTGPVDFLKMNIEGAEWDVIADGEPCLRHVREMVIEYHHLPGLPRTLHRILQVLDRCGFEYLINDFDGQTNPGACPPFRLTPATRYFLLIYARRRE